MSILNNFFRKRPYVVGILYLVDGTTQNFKYKIDFSGHSIGSTLFLSGSYYPPKSKFGHFVVTGVSSCFDQRGKYHVAVLNEVVKVGDDHFFYDPTVNGLSKMYKSSSSESGHLAPKDK
jgi:hypothetical protein